MDIASLVGLVVCLGMVVFGIISAGGVAAFPSYIDTASVIITIGGAFAACLASVTMDDFVKGLKTFGIIFRAQTNNTAEIIGKVIDLSNLARKEGLLAMEEAANNLEDPFLKKGILLIVDGTDPELSRAILETELISVGARHKKGIAFWEGLGTMGPAWGMIGTLVGLVNMLNNMDDPSSLGPNMAVALLTTLYGSLLANWICAPVANKLKVFSGEEATTKEIMIEGLLSIQAGENPRVIEEKLKSFLAPKDREGAGEEAGGAGGEE